jgi:hypothetical protein
MEGEKLIGNRKQAMVEETRTTIEKKSIYMYLQAGMQCPSPD